MDGGDPNIINKVIAEVLSKLDIGSTIYIIAQIPDGLRHLRNFAKQRSQEDILKEIMNIAKNPDYSSPILNIRNAYESLQFENRNQQFKEAQVKLDKVKDDFYVKAVQEQLDLNVKQINTFTKYKDPSLVGASMNNHIRNLIKLGKETEKDLKELKNSMKINEKAYFMMIIRGWA